MSETIIELSNLKPAKGSRKTKMRVGRGIGARKSKTSGRGDKGQLSRRGHSRRPGFEGGQMPLQRRVPKVGFTNIFRTEYQSVNVEKLKVFKDGEAVTPETLAAHRLVRRRLPIKILGQGDLKVKLTVTAHAFSASAREKIEKAGGKVDMIKKAAAAPKAKFVKKAKAAPKAKGNKKAPAAPKS
jgi:large subunit ribosomal protein L15